MKTPRKPHSTLLSSTVTSDFEWNVPYLDTQKKLSTQDHSPSTHLPLYPVSHSNGRIQTRSAKTSPGTDLQTYCYNPHAYWHSKYTDFYNYNLLHHKQKPDYSNYPSTLPGHFDLLQANLYKFYTSPYLHSRRVIPVPADNSEKFCSTPCNLMMTTPPLP